MARFHARQSLAFLAFEAAAVFAAVAFVVALLLAVDQVIPNDSGEPNPVAFAGAMVLILPIVLGRLGLRLLATWKAFRGEHWVIPGFGWVSRRWLPPADYQA